MTLEQTWKKRNKLYAEADKLWAEGDKLWAEAKKLYAEADIIWYDAVIKTYGPKAEIVWNNGACTIKAATEVTFK